MIHSAKDLSPDQKLAIENLLGHPIQENQRLSIRTLPASPAPQWLKNIRADAARNGLNAISAEDIDAEIAATRRTRSDRS